nr:hypothetical protein [Mycoplasmopsis bovis]
MRIFYKKGEKELHQLLRLIGDSLCISNMGKTKYIDLREEYGHWESDLIIGKVEWIW